MKYPGGSVLHRPPLIGFKMHSLKVQQHMQYLLLFAKYNTSVVGHVTVTYIMWHNIFIIGKIGFIYFVSYIENIANIEKKVNKGRFFIIYSWKILSITDFKTHVAHYFPTVVKTADMAQLELIFHWRDLQRITIMCQD